MPFELVLYRLRGRPPVTVEEVDRVLEKMPRFSREDIGGEKTQWRYKNPETGVHFAIKFDPDAKRVTHLEWNDSPLTISIALGRPSFFGQEASNIITRLLIDLNLAALDTQQTAVYRQPVKLTAEQIRTSWEKSNMAEAKAALSAGKSVAYAPSDRMDYFWRYMNARPALQESLGPDVLVPAINLHRAKDGSVKLSCIWPDAAKVALPEVDFVLVQREEKKLLSKKKVSGAAPYARIMEILRNRSEAKSDPVRLVVFNKAADKELLQYLSTIKLYSVKSYQKLSADDIVEVSK